MVKVLTFGSFDLIHPGHLYFLNEAKSYGDKLFVVVARDSTIEKVKGKKPKYNEKDRIQNIRDLGIADQVFLGDENDVYSVLDTIMPEIICLGYDQKFFVDKLEDELKKRNLKCKIIRIRAFMPNKFKSSKLKNNFA